MAIIEAKELLNQIEEASNFIKSKLTSGTDFKIGIVCGSGLGGLAETLSNTVSIPYSQIPHFPKATVAGHAGQLVFGQLQGVPTLCMVGRFHFYEGHPLHHVTFPIRVMATLGIKILIVTNAAGGLNKDYNVGDVMVIADHLSMAGLAGNNPLVGPNIDTYGPRFVATSDAYDIELRRIAFKAASQIPKELGELKMQEGIYANVSGPSYETRAEGRLLTLLGADAVGMSTVPEVIVAKHCGLRILGLSLITNNVITSREPPSYAEPAENQVEEVHATHEEVLAASVAKAKLMQDLVKNIVTLL
ncbi:purine nucleoside phosphorylase [Neoconidiobolus thromboides FSU 785]|nr:purine nucleoside phosphorylase [Neoconidiobolus thromboides FSU 785]